MRATKAVFTVKVAFKLLASSTIAGMFNARESQKIANLFSNDILTTALRIVNSKGGIWLKNRRSHGFDGEYFKQLDQFYDDPKYQNYCVKHPMDYIEHSSKHTFSIPLHLPNTWWARGITQVAGIIFAFYSVRINDTAPVHAALSGHTL